MYVSHIHVWLCYKVSKLDVWPPYSLSEKNKEYCITIASGLLSKRKNDPFFKNIITGDEKWVFLWQCSTQKATD